MATLTQQLDEAEAALHDLAIGKSMAECRDSNGEMVRYTMASRPALLAHIAGLKRRIADVLPPSTLRFSTSKGV